MSLRIRLSLMVSLLFLAGMLLGLSFLIGNARQRVAGEVESAASLTYQLLNSVLQDAGIAQGQQDHRQLLERLQNMENARHLDIYLTMGADSPAPVHAVGPAEAAPGWFVYLVESQPLELTVPLDRVGQEFIAIRTNPADEIAEVWVETRNFFTVLLLVLLLLNGFLYFTLGRWLAPVSAIVAGLDDVEQGDFSGHIAQAYLPELKVIAEKLNQLTTVLRTSKVENDRLVRRAVGIREEERRHLAHELHDELGQSISAIKAIAFSIAQRTAQSDAMSAEGAGKIGLISNDVSEHVRSMMSRLRPVILDELGLIPALQVMVDEWNNHHTETFCSFRASGDFSRLTAEQQISLYRIVQEALTNVARHADAERADVVLVQAEDYSLQISDDGRGYEPALVQQGMGLAGIRERCQALGARYSLFTTTGAGVRMEIRFVADRLQACT